MPLDAIDRRLLAILQENGRLTATELAERVGLTTSPCLRRLRLLEEAGVIRGYTALLDQSQVGLPVSVFVSIKLERQKEDALRRFEDAVKDCPEVLECYLMTGPRDYLLRVVASDLQDYERFVKETLTRIDGIANIESSFALGQVKHSNVLPVEGGPRTGRKPRRGR
ncbi:MAG TPA: Lrp/AsnC family transcriptional regulator [Hyphomicrobiaceae bacterium]|nr:Lrp/AsnC family transcriptional regulator [Hyphomicrobiaceae bacterium]